MKKSALLLLILMIGTKSFAQEGEDVGWVARFGAAAGLAPAFVFPNVDPINVELAKIGVPQLSSKGMFVYGGGGYAYIMIVDNFRLGGIGLSGSQSTSGKVGEDILLPNISFEAKHSFSFGGLTVEYTLPFINKVAVSVGAVIGLGTQSVDLYENYGNYDWTELFPQPVYSSKLSHPGTHSEIKNNFISITPTLNLDVPLNRFIALRVGGGYVLPISESWSMNNDQTINKIPSSLNAKSFFIQTGIYFGFFAF
ncbi:MAG: hypothetical protein Q8S39_01315 [Ignavibacteria bacterium]|nr:hypothetical protein [Ignavibacteria bacterium]